MRLLGAVKIVAERDGPIARVGLTDAAARASSSAAPVLHGHRYASDPQCSASEHSAVKFQTEAPMADDRKLPAHERRHQIEEAKPKKKSFWAKFRVSDRQLSAATVLMRRTPASPPRERK